MSSLAESLLLVAYDGQKRLIARQATLRAAIRTAVEEFELSEDEDDFELALAIGDIDAPLGASAYANLLQQKTCCIVKLQKAERQKAIVQVPVRAVQSPQPSRASRIKNRAPTPYAPTSSSTRRASDEEEIAATDKIELRVLGHDYKVEQVSIRRYSKLKRIIRPYAKRHNQREEDLKAFYNGSAVETTDTPESLGMLKGDTLVIVEKEVGESQSATLKRSAECVPS